MINLVYYWLITGINGWLVLWFYRLWFEGPPKNLTWASVARGYLFSLLLGPLTFVFFGCLLHQKFIKK